jgi:3-phosphoshikimate 1-carboxyvinyltransferase
MRISFTGNKAFGTVSPPPSKSHTHRAFMLASMADGTSIIKNPLLSADTESTLNAMADLGAFVDRTGEQITITGKKLKSPGKTINAENSGTTMRLLTGILSTLDEKTTVTGDESLLKRPMGPLLNALSQLGVECASDNGFPPISVKGPVRGNTVSVKGSISSQFVSSLMIAAPLVDGGLEIHIDGDLVSKPYVDITKHMMSLFGAQAELKNGIISAGGKYSPFDYCVPADFSSAAFPLVAGALAGKVSVKGMDLDDPQGDRKIVEILEKAGAAISVDGNTVTCTKKKLMGMELDIGNVPDLFPVLAVLFSVAEGKTRLFGAPQLRFKESDRIKSVATMIRDLGGDIEETDDGCIIRGVSGLKGGEINNLEDHRIMMAGAIASLVSDNPVTMDNAECCAVSYPEFPEHMKSLGMEVN